jgi:hypothetical protein
MPVDLDSLEGPPGGFRAQVLENDIPVSMNVRRKGYKLGEGKKERMDVFGEGVYRTGCELDMVS